ncbi:MAG: MarR family winged helix-turn-helix transcriptional regulator [Gemmatimonadaceae bacterium]
MPSDLRSDIKQRKPFDSPEQEAHLNIERTAAVLSHAFAEALKSHGITPTQYNVLRILRGAGTDGLCRNEVRDRMIAQVPDVTRLLDRLEDAGLIERERSTEDRRQVGTRITAKGLQLLSDLDDPVAEIHRRQLGHLSAAQLKTLADLLTIARQRP